MKKTLILGALCALSASAAHAVPWDVLGPRAMGMGGAQVAVAQGPLAAYWNPAGLGQMHNSAGLEAVGGARYEFTGSVLEGANDIHQLKKDCDASLTNCTTDRITAALSRLGQAGNGAMFDWGAGGALKIKKVVVFTNNLGYVGATPQVDLANNTAGTIANNASKLILRGGHFTEIGLGYAHEIKETGLIVGGNLKGIIGKIGYYALPIVTEDPANGALTKFSNGSKTSFQPGVDLGVLWDIRETVNLPMRPKLGLVARNINCPTFSQPDTAKAAGERSRYPLHSQVRAGAAISPFKFWHLAADMDLTENLTPIDGYKSRYMSLGTEVNIFNSSWINIPLRAGLQKNLSSAGSGLAYTGGFGLNFLHVMVDIGAQVSAKQTTLQSEGKSTKVPSNLALAGRVAFLFGGQDEGARDKKD